MFTGPGNWLAAVTWLVCLRVSPVAGGHDYDMVQAILHPYKRVFKA